MQFHFCVDTMGDQRQDDDTAGSTSVDCDDQSEWSLSNPAKDCASIDNSKDQPEEKIRSKILASQNSANPNVVMNNVSFDTANDKIQYIDSVLQINVSSNREKKTLESNSGFQNQTSDELQAKQNIVLALQSTDRFGPSNRKFGADDLDTTVDPTVGEALLAVAIPIVEPDDDDDRFLPAAIEFDPDKRKSTVKATHRSNRRKIVIVALLTVVIIISLTVGIIVGTKKDKEITNPFHPRLNVGILEYLESQFPSDTHKFRDSTHPFAKAMHWMTYDDPQSLTPSLNKTFLQRFLMVYLYYQTTQSNDWDYCTKATNTKNPRSRCDSQCMIFSYSRADGLSLETSSARFWMSSRSECDWVNNKCDAAGNIQQISLGKRVLLKMFNANVFDGYQLEMSPNKPNGFFFASFYANLHCSNHICVSVFLSVKLGLVSMVLCRMNWTD
jgi:hypothetical protein